MGFKCDKKRVKRMRNQIPAQSIKAPKELINTKVSRSEDATRTVVPPSSKRRKLQSRSSVAKGNKKKYTKLLSINAKPIKHIWIARVKTLFS